MKKQMNNINERFKTIIYLFLFCCLSFIINFIYTSNKKNFFEGFRQCTTPSNPNININDELYDGFDWNSFHNNTNKNINNLIDINTPLSYYPNSNNLCTFPNCNTFSGVENNWNRKIVNNTGNNTGNNYRVITSPTDFLKFNIVSPNCCTYSKDYTSGGGCVCITPQQQQLLDFRYGNRA